MVRGPGLPEMTRLGRIHVLNFFRDGGIWVKWKQYMTSGTWSKPILLIPESDMPRVAAWRPAQRQQCFKQASTKLAWLNKFEVSLADANWSLHKHSDALAQLRALVNSRAPWYQAGPNVEEILTYLMKLGGDGQAAVSATASEHAYPADQIVQLFPGARVTGQAIIIRPLERSRIVHQPAIILHDAIPDRLPNCKKTLLWNGLGFLNVPEFGFLNLVSSVWLPEFGLVRLVS